MRAIRGWGVAVVIATLGGCAIQGGNGGIMGSGLGVDTRTITATEVQNVHWADGGSAVLRRTQAGTYQIKASNAALIDLGVLPGARIERADVVDGSGVLLLATGHSCGDGHRLLRLNRARWDMWILSNCHGPLVVDAGGTNGAWRVREQVPAGLPYTQWTLDKGRLTHADVVPSHARTSVARGN